MFRLMKKFSAMMIVAAICLMAFTSVNAADGATINGDFTAKLGDKFTYSMYMSDCKEEVLGVQMYVFYDQDCLEIDAESVEFDQFKGAIFNANLEGYMTFNWTNISELADFSTRRKIVSMDFTVLKEEDTEITYFIREMYGNGTETLKSYKLTYDIVKDGEDVVIEKTPLVNESDQVLEEYQGDFINYLDGMGDENTPNKENHKAHKGEKSTMLPAGNVDTSSQSESDASGSTYLVIICVVVLVMLIGVVFILKNRSSSK